MCIVIFVCQKLFEIIEELSYVEIVFDVMLVWLVDELLCMYGDVFFGQVLVWKIFGQYVVGDWYVIGFCVDYYGDVFKIYLVVVFCFSF